MSWVSCINLYLKTEPGWIRRLKPRTWEPKHLCVDPSWPIAWTTQLIVYQIYDLHNKQSINYPINRSLEKSTNKISNHLIKLMINWLNIRSAIKYPISWSNTQQSDQISYLNQLIKYPINLSNIRLTYQISNQLIKYLNFQLIKYLIN